MAAPTVRTLIEDLEALEKAVTPLRDQRDQVREEAGKWAKKRDELNKKLQGIAKEIREYKAKRNDLNEKVQQLKAQRDEMYRKIAEKREEMKKILDKLEPLQKQGFRGVSALKKRLDELEWEIQTNPYNPNDEKWLIDQIKSLESQLVVPRKVEDLKQKLMELRIEIGGLRIRAKKTHAELTQIANESEGYHIKMMEFVKEASAIKEKADEAHKVYLENKAKADEIHHEYAANAVKMKELKQQIRNLEQLERSKKSEEVKKKTEETAAHKMKRGQKLSFEEFKALVEKGAI